MEKQVIKIIVPASLEHSSLVRHFANDVFGVAQFSKEWASRLKLVVDELFMNAVRYGSTEAKSSVYITFEFDEKSIRFTIEDDGTGKQAISVEELQAIIQQNEQNKDLARTSGRGLSMITKLWTDKMEVAKSQYGGIAVTFTKNLETTPPPPPPPPTGLVQQAVQKAASAAPQAPAPAAPKGPVYEIKLSGEIDQSNIEEAVAPVYDQIETIPKNAVLVLDFSDVEYINSTFIGNLAAWHTHMQKKGGQVCLKNVNDQIREVLELVGLLNILKCPAKT